MSIGGKGSKKAEQKCEIEEELGVYILIHTKFSLINDRKYMLREITK